MLFLDMSDVIVYSAQGMSLFDLNSEAFGFACLFYFAFVILYVRFLGFQYYMCHQKL